MPLLKNFYLKILRYDFVNKSYYKKINSIPNIKKIILNFNCKTTNINKLATSLLAMELICAQKPIMTTAKSPNISLKIKKGAPIGCKVILKKRNQYEFLEKLIENILPKLKNFNGFNLKKKIIKNTFSYQFKDVLSFPEIEKKYYLFTDLSFLNITIVTNCKMEKELIFLLKSFKLSVINMQI